MGQHTDHAALGEAGDISAFLAAALLLPLLFLLVWGGIGVITLMHAKDSLLEATQQGLLATELSGGVTPAVRSLVSQDTSTDPLLALAAPTISGSMGPVPWGGPVQLTVAINLPLAGPPWAWLGVPDPLDMSLTLYGLSNAPP